MLELWYSRIVSLGHDDDDDDGHRHRHGEGIVLVESFFCIAESFAPFLE